MTIQTADPYAPDTDLRAERDKAAALGLRGWIRLDESDINSLLSSMREGP